MFFERYPKKPAGTHSTFRGIDLQAKPIFYKICKHKEFDIRPTYYSYRFAIKMLKTLRVPYIPTTLYFSRRSRVLVIKMPWCKGKTLSQYSCITAKLREMPQANLIEVFLFTWLFNFYDCHEENFMVTKKRTYIIDFEDILYTSFKRDMNENILYSEYFKYRRGFAIDNFKNKTLQNEEQITRCVIWCLNKLYPKGYDAEIGFADFKDRLQRLKRAATIGDLFQNG